MDRSLVTKNSMRIDTEDEIRVVLDIPEKEDGRSYGEKKADFWKMGDIFATDSIKLRNVEEKDKDVFIELQREYYMFKSRLKEEEYQNMLWNEHIEEKALMCSIDENRKYVGYCGIANTALDKWELAIEISKNKTNQGIGYAAVRAFAEALKDRLGIKELRIRIDPENVASQKLFEKLGAVPNGISAYMLHDDDDLRRCEEENMDLIDENIMAIAERFGVEPRRLLSHILEYKLILS